jgi:hypothetical protein
MMLQLVTGNESLSCKVVADQQSPIVYDCKVNRPATPAPRSSDTTLVDQRPVKMWSFSETMTDVFFAFPSPPSAPRSVGETKRFGLQDLGLICPPVEIYLSNTANIKAQLMGLTFQSHLSSGTARAYVQRTA